MSDQFTPRNYDESTDVTRDVERDDVTGEPIEDAGEDAGKWGNQPQPPGGVQNEVTDGDPGFSGVADTTEFGDASGSE